MYNPVGFFRVPVTLVICVVYIALAAALLYTHHVTPPAPKNDAAIKGTNLTTAWRDLQTLTNGFHPYNSRRNDAVRDFLLERIKDILSTNNVNYTTEQGQGLAPADAKPSLATIFDDRSLNRTFYYGTVTTYFESTNIIVYIRGTQDDEHDWWRQPQVRDNQRKPHGVLVNAHIDSVATGFGATDDGVGVVTLLQLLQYYSSKDNQPKRGIVLLFNNGEEDFLNGARVFMQHPISRFPNKFLNLEGAGAGGRAVLFRSTDAEVTKAYAKSPYPFGTVIAADAFERGVIRSQTDYIVFNEELGMRGLDVAFFEPRTRYHTLEDSTRYTSKDSVWHMLSAAVTTTKALSSDTKTRYPPYKGHRGVWWDMFGRAFGIMTLEALFGLNVTLLVATPIFLLLVLIVLARADRLYLFASTAQSDPLDPRAPDEVETVDLGGWRGYFRFPIAFVLATGAVVGLAFLVTKINPFIAYSSPYSVFSMMLSAWFVITWFFLRGADFMRPSALHRAHILGWVLFIFWVLLVASAAAENVTKISGTYVFVLYYAAAFVALLLSYLELFALPTKESYVEDATYTGEEPPSRNRGFSTGSSQARGEGPSRGGRHDEEATETTSLLKKRPASRSTARTEQEESDTNPLIEALEKLPFGEEQAWSTDLPSWLWVIQFVILATVALVIVGPVALFMISANRHTSSDGNPSLPMYLALAAFTVLLLLPTSPFIHRVKSQVSRFLFLVFIGTLIYNLTAFPFSGENRLKVYFQQQINVDTGENTVSLTGALDYVRQVVESIPSASEQKVRCKVPELASRAGLATCSWTGLPPQVVPDNEDETDVFVRNRFKHWIEFDIALNKSSGVASFNITGRNTRNCRITWDDDHGSRRFLNISIAGAAPPFRDEAVVGDTGSTGLRLWSRTWGRQWAGTFAVNGTAAGARGKAQCEWADANESGTIPAYDEVVRFLPAWAVVTKLDDGLVQGFRPFTL